MARDFEDHCWKDVIDADTIQIYQAYRRKIYVGDNPAVLAIDLYNKAYRGGDRPVKEVDREFSGSCGEHAWKALAPTQDAVCGRTPRRRADHLHHPPRRHRRRAFDQPQHRPRGRRHLRHQGRTCAGAGRAGDLQGARLGLLRHAADRASATETHRQPDHLRRKHLGLRARVDRRRLFLRLPQCRGRGMHLRPLARSPTRSICSICITNMPTSCISRTCSRISTASRAGARSPEPRSYSVVERLTGRPSWR